MRPMNLILTLLCTSLLFVGAGASSLRAEGSPAEVAAWCTIAAGLLAGGNPAGALWYYVRGLQYQPTNSGILLAMGKCHQELKQWDIAIGCTEKAWCFAGTNNQIKYAACAAKGWIMLARADYLKGQGDTAGATYWYQQALSVGNYTKAPGDPSGYGQGIVNSANAGLAAISAAATAAAAAATATAAAATTTAAAATTTAAATTSSGTTSTSGAADAEDWTDLSSRQIVNKVAATAASARSAEVVLTKAQLYALIRYARNVGRLQGTATVAKAAETTSATSDF